MVLYLESQFSRLKQYQPPAGTGIRLRSRSLVQKTPPAPHLSPWILPSRKSNHRRLPLDSFK